MNKLRVLRSNPRTKRGVPDPTVTGDRGFRTVKSKETKPSVSLKKKQLQFDFTGVRSCPFEGLVQSLFVTCFLRGMRSDNCLLMDFWVLKRLVSSLLGVTNSLQTS